MSKKKKIDKNKDKIVRSINNNIRSSVRKLNPILKGIVGKKVEIAIRDLQFSEKRITKDIRKTINSAVANAENNFGLNSNDLYISKAIADEGPTLKRFRPRARGRAGRINKRTSHLLIELASTGE